MRDEQHSDAFARADALDERGDGRLVGQVEAVQRLVEDQELRAAHERLREQQPLLLAAGELADRAVGVARRADEAEHLGDPGVLRAAALAATPGDGERHAPAIAVEAEANEVDAADPRVVVEAVPLGDVADARSGRHR